MLTIDKEEIDEAIYFFERDIFDYQLDKDITYEAFDNMCKEYLDIIKELKEEYYHLLSNYHLTTSRLIRKQNELEDLNKELDWYYENVVDWILVEEKSPEEKGLYICTIEFQDNTLENSIEKIYFDGEKWQTSSSLINVIAWIPFKAYKKEK